MKRKRQGEKNEGKGRKDIWKESEREERTMKGKRGNIFEKKVRRRKERWKESEDTKPRTTKQRSVKTAKSQNSEKQNGEQQNSDHNKTATITE